MTKLSLEVTIIRLHAFILLCRTNPWVKDLQNSIFFQILKEFYIDMKLKRILKKILFLSYFLFCIIYF